MSKNTFQFKLTAPSSLRYLDFCPEIFGHVGKRFDEKAKVKFKISGIINQETNNYNTNIA